MIQLPQNQITDIKAFLYDGKPAFLYNPQNIPWFYEKHEIEALKQYPFVGSIVSHTISGLIMYFQDEMKRTTFLEAIRGLEVNSPEYHEQIGIALGYPPKAARFYSLFIQDEERFRCKKVGIQFNGCGCIGHVEDIEDNVRWLWERYPESWYHKRDLEIAYTPKKGVPSTWYNIPYQDLQKLSFVAKEIKASAV